MDIKAFKMDGLGNDFVIIDQRYQNYNLTKDQIIKICDRKFIGCDQLIFIKKSDEKDAGLEFYNSDGSISGACGNGTRCVADLLSKENNNKEITLWTSSGVLKSQILGGNLVETEIGIPKTNWDEIPLNKNLDTKNLNIKIINKNNIELVGGTSVNVGNPHVIFFGKSISVTNLNKIGPSIENHKYFPNKTNVELVEVINRNTLKMRVWERGVGITLACGSGACASVYAAWKKKLTDNKVEVIVEKGSLIINILDGKAIMTGPAEISYHGNLEI